MGMNCEVGDIVLVTTGNTLYMGEVESINDECLLLSEGTVLIKKMGDDWKVHPTFVQLQVEVNYVGKLSATSLSNIYYSKKYE